jgi:hypothetical protein
LTSQIKDKRVSESLKDRPGKEPGYMVRLNMEQIPLLDLGENSQFLPGNPAFFPSWFFSSCVCHSLFMQIGK